MRSKSTFKSGLLLLTSQKKKELIYHVLNPLTRETFSLPQSCKTGNVVRCGLTVNGHLNYQVVVVEHVSSGLELEIFPSETGGWKRNRPFNLFSPCPWKDLFPAFTLLPLFSNNAIHWELPDHLLIYNVQNSHCKLIKLP